MEASANTGKKIHLGDNLFPLQNITFSQDKPPSHTCTPNRIKIVPDISCRE
ncbi:MAG TPA: hypothetical protein VGE90_04285 [Chitinophaga sp.]